MVDAILAMSSSLGLDVVAEGIEDEKQARLLGDMGCRYAQGYFYARPLPATEILAYLENHGRVWAGASSSPN
jgi:EAL domain-containing protein (putative c-di-GMP-specific phosphodiesterase class I)